MSQEFYQGYQYKSADTNNHSVYSLPLKAKRAQLFIKVANVDTNAAHVRVFHDANGSSYTEATALVWDMKILPGQILEIDHVFMANPSGNIAYRSDTADALTITIYAIEDYF